MARETNKIYLFPHLFLQHEIEFLSASNMKALVFRYPSGVCAVRIINKRGEIVVLPFHGQQVWDAQFDGRRIKMETAVKEPKDTQDFLSNMGGFLFHCGMGAMGSPGPDDDHPIHGELVNAKYQHAYLEAGSDENGSFIGLGGVYEHSAAFGNHYTANPTLRLYENESLINFTLRVKNLNRTPMEYMYLAHINFHPVDMGELVYSARYDADHVRIRANFPSHMQPKEDLLNFVNILVKNPTVHHITHPDHIYDPEIVFMIDYEADDEGWAHALHIHPDGSADYVRHRPAQLDHGIRWICRTPNQQALGMEVGTAGVEGYSAEKNKGNVKVLAPGGEFFCEYTSGLVDKLGTEEIRKKIDTQMGRNKP